MKYARVWLGVVSSLLSVGVFAADAVTTQVLPLPDKNVIQIEIQLPGVNLTRSAEGTIPEIPGLPSTIEAGMPKVPLVHLNVALPIGKRVARIESVRHNESSSTGTVVLSKGMAPLSWLQHPPSNRNLVEAPRVPRRYPQQNAVLNRQIKHGVEIASINAFPLSVEGETITWGDSMSVRLLLEDTPNQGAPLTREQRNSIEALVANPEALTQRAERRAKYDYLIIATSLVADYAGENNLKGLQDSLANRNLVSKVVRLTDVLKTEGNDDAAKIRNFIKQEYEQSAIRFVLLAGKAKTSGGGEVIANRKLWSKIRVYLNAVWSDHTEEIAGDIYFSNLDGTFDGNGNGKFGEPNDGENNGDVDFLSEVSVGRATLESDTDVASFVKKSIWAAENKLSKNALSAGEELFPELNLSGMDYLIQLVGGSDDHGFMTKGLSSEWKVDELDDRKGSWSGSTALKMMNSGNYALVNHLGHSNTSYNMKLSTTFGMPKFTNPNPFFYYTQGCLAGRFFDGSIVDKLARHPAAAFAAMGNSAYGLAPEDPDPSSTKTPGTSHMVHRQFIHAMVSGVAKTFGAAHQASKEMHLKYINAQEMRWVNWTANYFGDPSLPVPF